MFRGPSLIMATSRGCTREQKGDTILQDAPIPQEGSVSCMFCDAPTNAETGRMTLFVGDRLIVIEGVPTHICSVCGEEFYEESILSRVEDLRLNVGAANEPVRIVEVPVYTWDQL